MKGKGLRGDCSDGVLKGLRIFPGAQCSGLFQVIFRRGAGKPAGVEGALGLVLFCSCFEGWVAGLLERVLCSSRDVAVELRIPKPHTSNPKQALSGCGGCLASSMLLDGFA